MKITLRWLALLVFFISNSPTSLALASKSDKAQELHDKLKIIDSKLKLKLKLSSILDLEWLRKLSRQDLKLIRDAHAKRAKASLEQPESERVYMGLAFVVDVLFPYYYDLERHLPESDEEKSKLYHRMLNLILFTEENLDDMLAGETMWLMSPVEYAHLSDQVKEAKKHKHEFRKRYGHLDQESLYNIAMPHVYKGVAFVVVAAVTYGLGKWYFSKGAVAQKEPEVAREVESPRRRGRSRVSEESQRTIALAEPAKPREVPLTEEQIEQRYHAKECAERIKAINHILTTEDKSVDEADFSNIHDEIVQLRYHAQKIPSDKETLKSIRALSERIGHVASEFKNLLQEDDLQFSKSGLDDFLEGT